MTSINFQFSDYPTWRRPGKAARRFDGFATIELAETPRLPTTDTSSKMLRIPPLPLQRPLRFIIREIVLGGFPHVAEIRDDIERYIRGRYWPRIQCLLYAEFMRESDLPDYAAVYFQLGERP